MFDNKNISNLSILAVMPLKPTTGISYSHAYNTRRGISIWIGKSICAGFAKMEFH